MTCRADFAAQVRTNAVKWAWSVYRRSLPNQTAHMKASRSGSAGNVAYLLTRMGAEIQNVPCLLVAVMRRGLNCRNAIIDELTNHARVVVRCTGHSRIRKLLRRLTWRNSSGSSCVRVHRIAVDPNGACLRMHKRHVDCLKMCFLIVCTAPIRCG